MLTGNYVFDKNCGGLKTGTITSIFGNVNEGKTTCICSLIKKPLEKGKNIIFFSFDHKHHEIEKRIECKQTKNTGKLYFNTINFEIKDSEYIIDIIRNIEYNDNIKIDLIVIDPFITNYKNRNILFEFKKYLYNNNKSMVISIQTNRLGKFYTIMYASDLILKTSVKHKKIYCSVLKCRMFILNGLFFRCKL